MSTVSFSKNLGRKGNISRVLSLLKEDIEKSLENKKKILIKPNMVSDSVKLASVQAEALEPVIEFLSQIGDFEIVIGESSAGYTKEAFENFGYYELSDKYDVKLTAFEDLREYEYIEFVRNDMRQTIANIYKIDYDYLISLALIKTHDHAICTFSLKNMVGFLADKIKVHGGLGYPTGLPKEDYVACTRAIHINLFRLAERKMPDLSIIDGFQGMEGNGPISGDAVNLNVALCSLDPLASDSVAARIMGIEPKNVGYLYYVNKKGLGQTENIEIIGGRPEKRAFKMHKLYEWQKEWR